MRQTCSLALDVPLRADQKAELADVDAQAVCPGGGARGGQCEVQRDGRVARAEARRGPRTAGEAERCDDVKVPDRVRRAAYDVLGREVAP